MLTKCLAIVAILSLALPVQGQQAVLSCGGDAQDAAGSLAWSVGQVAYTAPTAATGIVSQGVQQPYVSITTDVHEGIDDAAWLMVGPNPTLAGVTLWMNDGPSPGTFAQLFNAAGQRVTSFRVSSNTMDISMDGLAGGTYTLLVSAPGRAPSSTRIIKH